MYLPTLVRVSPFLLSILTFAAPVLAAPSPYAARPCGTFFQPTEPGTDPLERALTRSEVNGTEILNILNQDQTLSSLLNADAGVQEGYTVREHTLRVFDTLNELCGYHDELQNISAPTELRIFPALKYALALHDIGKPLAIAAGDRSRQHEFTANILDLHLTRAPLTPAEGDLIRALVTHDVLGLYLQQKLTLEETLTQLKQRAATTPLSLREFFALQLVFYTADAASYPWLRGNVFESTATGRLIPKIPRYKDLLEAIARQ